MRRAHTKPLEEYGEVRACLHTSVLRRRASTPLHVLVRHSTQRDAEGNHACSTAPRSLSPRWSPAGVFSTRCHNLGLRTGARPPWVSGTVTLRPRLMKPVRDDFRVYILSHDFALNMPPLSTAVDRSHEPHMPHLFQTEMGESKIGDAVLMKCVAGATPFTAPPLLGVFKLAARSLPTSPTVCVALRRQSIFRPSYVKY